MLSNHHIDGNSGNLIGRTVPTHHHDYTTIVPTHHNYVPTTIPTHHHV